MNKSGETKAGGRSSSLRTQGRLYKHAITMSIYAHELREDLEQVRVAMGKFG